MAHDPFNPTGSLPSDQTMLLRVIDARFETSNTKVDAVAASLKTLVESVQALTAKYDKRFDDHEHRLSAIEGDLKARALQVADFEQHKIKFAAVEGEIVALKTWQTEEQTTSRNAGKWGSAIWGAVGSGVTAGVMFVATLYFQAQPQPTQPVHQEQGQHAPSGTETNTYQRSFTTPTN